MTHGIFPNLLGRLDSPIQVQLFLGLLTLLSIALTLGVLRPVVSVVLWYGWVCLFNRNNLILNPGLPYVGWILLLLAVIPRGEPIALFSPKKEGWQMPKLLYWGAWALMLVGYTISGFDKLGAPSWRNGEAISILVDNPLARDWFVRSIFDAAPMWMTKTMTWSVLGIEIISAFMIFHRWTRKIIWFALLGMHLGILLIVDFADLTLGMLMIHFLVFDASWLKPKGSGKSILFFDGVCGLCNSTVDLLMSEDRLKVLRFSALQGSTASETLPEEYIADLNTMVYHDGEKNRTRSTGVLKALRDTGGFWRLFYVLILIPRPLRDGVYSFVGKNRYKWFGKHESCRMPTAEERGRILP